MITKKVLVDYIFIPMVEELHSVRERLVETDAETQAKIFESLTRSAKNILKSLQYIDEDEETLEYIEKRIQEKTVIKNC